MDELTPLQQAIEDADLGEVRSLLGRGADPNEAGRRGGWAPLHLALKHPAIRNLLIERGAAVDICAAAGMGDLAKVEALAQLPRKPGPDGATPLHFAVTVEIAEFLLAQGAGLEARDTEHGMTPLEWQAINPPVAQLLLSRGAKVGHPFLAALLGDTEALDGFITADSSVLHAGTAPDSFYGEGATLLHMAAMGGHVPAIEWLLDRGAQINRSGGWFDVTPLHWAAEHGRAAAAGVLLKNGADPTARDSMHDATPAEWAEFFGHPEIVALLQ